MGNSKSNHTGSIVRRRRSMKDLSGQTFTKLKVISGEPVRRDDHGEFWWRVRCECGTEKEVRGSGLRSGKLKTCGASKCTTRHSSRQLLDLSGKTFGLLEVVGDKPCGKHARGFHMWRVRCKGCGVEKEVSAGAINSQGTSTCGRPGCIQIYRGGGKRGSMQQFLAWMARKGSAHLHEIHSAGFGWVFGCPDRRGLIRYISGEGWRLIDSVKA